MSTAESIAACLISCRNVLFGGRTNPNVLACLEQVIASVREIEIDSTRNIVRICVPEAMHQIEESRFVSAALILNLIHNLPLTKAGEESWDIDYFFSMELSQFLERYAEVPNSRAIVLYVCSQISCRYLGPDK